MDNENMIERDLYAEWNRSRERSENYKRRADECKAAGDTRAADYYERLAHLAWTQAVDILGLIYEFETGKEAF